MISMVLVHPFANLPINLEPNAKLVVDHQRQLNPKMKDVVRTEVLKLLAAGIIYPIADSKWVCAGHCVPKKGGITVVPNDKIIEEIASIAIPPNDPLRQFMEDHENDMHMHERNELDDIFLRQPAILKHNLPVEPLGILSQPKEDPVFDLKPLPDTLKYAYLDEKKIYTIIINSNLSGF